MLIHVHRWLMVKGDSHESVHDALFEESGFKR